MLSSSLTLSDPPSEEEEAHAEGIATGAARRLAIAQAMLSKQQHQKLASPSPTVSALPNAGNRTPPGVSGTLLLNTRTKPAPDPSRL